MLYYVALMRPLLLCPQCFETEVEKLANVRAGATTVIQGQKTWLVMKDKKPCLVILCEKKLRSKVGILCVFYKGNLGMQNGAFFTASSIQIWRLF